MIYPLTSQHESVVDGFNLEAGFNLDRYGATVTFFKHV